MPKTLVLKLDAKRPDESVISYAAAGIRYGRLVALPTETVYGLAANRDDKKALKALYAAKRRPRGKPLTVHIADVSIIRRMGCPLTKAAKALITKFWPGPLTLVLKARTGEKIGFRMPANRIALEIIRKAAVPVVMPSANLSGDRPPTDARAVARSLGDSADLIIDGGRASLGIESTVVDLTVPGAPAVLREGAISASRIAKAIGAHG